MTAPGTIGDETRDRGVDVNLISAEIEDLRQAALLYACAVAEDAGAIAVAGLDLESAALRYVRRRAAEGQRARLRRDLRAGTTRPRELGQLSS